MPLTFEADYYDGRQSKAHRVLGSIDEQILSLNNEEITLHFLPNQIDISPNVGSARSVAFLGEGKELHITDLMAVKALVDFSNTKGLEALFHRFEKGWRYPVLALVCCIAVIFSSAKWGIPWLADYAASQLPSSVEAQLGEQSQPIIDRIFEPSQLSESIQHNLENKLQHLCQTESCPNWKLVFKNSPQIGANAMALPGGTIIVTDDLVKQSVTEDEVIAVIAHEMGHLYYRHSLRLIMRSTGFSILIAAIASDISNVSNLLSTLPAVLLDASYSRTMENEADTYALNWLRRNCIAPQHFADILTRISKSTSSNSWFNSHPQTEERIIPFTKSELKSCER
jgi:Zn-dependent protease with chaperone function